MPSEEIFPNPVVKQVIFQIRYPNLFFLEGRIGDFQIKIMKDFPESNLLLQKHLLVVSETDSAKSDEAINKARGAPPEVSKVWQFVSKNGVRLDVSADSLSLVTEQHKSYRLGDSKNFRGMIDFVLREFFLLTGIPFVTRIGLRYVDECPVPDNTSQTFHAYYNSVFPLNRFPLESSEALEFRAIFAKPPHKMQYAAFLQKTEAKSSLIIDIDASSENIESEKVLETCDQLHDLIWGEFSATIKEPVLEYMRKGVAAQ